MKEYQFKDIMKGFYDGPHATPEPSDEGPIFLGIKNIFDNGGIDFSNIRHISENEYPKWTKRVVPQKNDLVFSYEATLHKYALIPEGFRGCLGRRMALIRVNKSLVCENYLYQYFLSEYWRAFVETIKISGSTVERISISEFPNYKITLPPLPIQQKIASILSAYDELIENNKQRIKLLEEIAEEIYKEWFVRLRFPNYENTEFVDGLPLGWEKKELKNFVYVSDGTHDSPKSSNVGFPLVTGKNIKNSFIDTSDTYFISEEEHIKIQKRSYLNIGDIIISNIGTIGSTALIFEKPKFSVKNVIILRPQRHNLSNYLYTFIKSKHTQIIFQNEMSGSSQPFLSLSYMRKFKILMPSTEILLKYESIIGNSYQMQYQLYLKNQLLQQTRDLLLPRLISGKLSVAGLLGDNVYKIGENEESLSMAAEDGHVYGITE